MAVAGEQAKVQSNVDAAQPQAPLLPPHENVSRHGSWDLINLNFSAQPLDEKMKQSGFGCYCSLLPEPESRRNFSRPVTCALDSRLEEDLSVCLFTSSLSFLLQLINKPELVTTNFSETVAVC
jgi:hypothetical protein